jgi:IS30 family transposase
VYNAFLVPDLSAQSAYDAEEKYFNELTKGVAKTVTYDNGSENHLHYKIRDKFGVDTYFCDPYASWQKGSNERGNRELRKYFPKGFDFSTITQEDLDEVIDTINNKPMKVLGGYTPYEMWDREMEKYALTC